MMKKSVKTIVCIVQEHRTNARMIEVYVEVVNISTFDERPSKPVGADAVYTSKRNKE